MRTIPEPPEPPGTVCGPAAPPPPPVLATALVPGQYSGSEPGELVPPCPPPPKPPSPPALSGPTPNPHGV